MQRQYRALFLAVLSLLLVQIASATTEFVAVTRLPDGTAWLLPAGGQALYEQRGNAAPKAAITFRLPDGTPFVWHTPPFGFAHWRDSWLVADGGSTLWFFKGDGTFVDAVPLPVPITDLATDGRQTIWLYSSVMVGFASKDIHALWQSRDGAHFTPLNVELVRATPNRAVALLEGQILIAGGSRDDLVFVHDTGPPALIRVEGKGGTRTVPLAYSRTKARATLEHYRPGFTELTAYSSPARDVAVEKNGDVLVLRNREDVFAGKKVTTVHGLRVDRYRNAQHTGTATFPSAVRFILRSDATSVVGLSQEGLVVSAAFDRPVPGAILP